MKTLIREDCFGVYNGIDRLAADPRAFDTLAEAEAELKVFKTRFRFHGFYRSAEGYHLPLLLWRRTGKAAAFSSSAAAKTPRPLTPIFGPKR